MERDNILAQLDLLINSCFKIEKQNSILLLDTNADNDVILNSHYNAYTPLYLFKNDDTTVFKNHRRFRRVYRLNETHVKQRNNPVVSAIIIASGVVLFTEMLDEFRNSIWWNNKAYFLIVDKTSEANCQMAQVFLKAAWDFNILSVIYLCMNSNNNQTLMMHTYNPYTNLAPILWSEVRTRESINTPWTLFACPVNALLKFGQREDNNVCSALFFDKTTDLNGYNLKIISMIDERSFPYDKTKEGYSRCYSIPCRMLFIILSHINAPITFKIASEHGYVDEYGQPHGPLKDVLSGLVDITAILYFIHTADDLIKSDLKIYGIPSNKELILENEIRERFLPMKAIKNCYYRLEKGERIACILADSLRKYYVQESKRIHISNGNLIEKPTVYVCAEDWPLLGTIQHYVLLMNAAGLIKFCQRIEKLYFAKTDCVIEETMIPADIKLKNMRIIFNGLIVIWLLGSLSLFLEVVIFKLKKYAIAREYSCLKLDDTKYSWKIYFRRLLNRQT
ncbi:hypothetical protein TSAR_017030 [Trichomalopsis sarcophagae]|uniref:Uncharacterized protein n=1 Tax=Trichomalopsis sarcophagae TaxID=543379 RepID=A0A232FH15_9HYME|nr:hypothetical protein TSAR_017030 [Trichomalopsis sarcophagae]